MTRAKLSKRRQEIYDFICVYSSEHGYPPTVREIAQATHLASTSTVASHLAVLEKENYIKRNPNTPRALEIVPDEEQELPKAEPTYERPAEFEPRYEDALPLVGQVAAGQPIYAEDNIETYINVPTEILGDKGTFILKVTGESMINAGILDGDYIIVQQQPTAFNGQIVVALIDDSATVKTFYREKDRIRLQPENDYMDPIYAENPKILGIVVGLLRRL